MLSLWLVHRGWRARVARHRAGCLTAIALALVTVLAAPVPAQEAVPDPQSDPGTPPTAPAEGAGLLPGLDARLVGVPLAYGPSSGDVQALKDAEARLAALTDEQAALQARQVDLANRIAVLDEMQRQAIAELEVAEADRRRLTALVYSKGNSAWQAAALLQTDDAMEAARVNQLGEDFSTALRAAILRAKIARRRASAESARLAIERVEVDQRLVTVQQVELPGAQRDVAVLRVHAASSVAGGEVAGLGIPLATLDAYLRAEGTLLFERSGCGIQWWMLAGIGRVESNHGRYGGTQLGANGDTLPHIVGIPLDGAPGIAAIGDSDGGLLDDDGRGTVPSGRCSSSRARGAGTRPTATGTAAPIRTTCTTPPSAPGATCAPRPATWRTTRASTRAYLSYNHSDAYAANVLYLAREYQHSGLPKPL